MIEGIIGFIKELKIRNEYLFYFGLLCVILSIVCLVLTKSTSTQVHGVNAWFKPFKFAEPSYLTKYGSTIRMDWKEKNPEEYAIYFKCTSSLVETFKIIYKDKFKFNGKRAIIFQLNDKVPKTELKHCISLALKYHKVKQLPLLGV